MRHPYFWAGGVLAVAMTGMVAPAMAAQGHGTCAALSSMKLADTIVTAEEVTGGSLAPKGERPITGLPPFCRVALTTKPAVKYEVWLPLENWNGKFEGVGNGANAGSIQYGAMATALKRGYASGSTDTGHETENARDASWALGHPELVVDFGYRGIHVMSDNGKKVVKQFYSTPAAHSYFVACSTGGRQSMMEAQRFPEDYDGIIAGAPAFNWSKFQTGGHLWDAAAMNLDPESYLPAAKLKALGDAVNAACDKLDGVADGIINDPRQCNYDAKALQCPAGEDNAGCLTPKQVKAVNDIWAGSKTSKGELIYPGISRGAEAAQGGWNMYTTGTGPMTGSHWDQAENTMKYIIVGDKDWKIGSYNVEKDAAAAVKKLGKTMDAFDPDLSKFRARGGRLIMYHGFNDPNISPQNTINYYESVIATMKKGAKAQDALASTQEFARLFLVPGMLHCGGGPGAGNLDMVAALENWVEKKQAPDQVIGSHMTAGKVDRTRPVCAYPKQAVYSGSGSSDDAANFSCSVPK